MSQADTINVPIEISKRQLKALSWQFGSARILSRDKIRDYVDGLWIEQIVKIEKEYREFKKTNPPHEQTRTTQI